MRITPWEKMQPWGHPTGTVQIKVIPRQLVADSGSPVGLRS
jgi:hypothetical protein